MRPHPSDKFREAIIPDHVAEKQPFEFWCRIALILIVTVPIVVAAIAVALLCRGFDKLTLSRDDYEGRWRE